ncbi:MAG TPA: hypothetical protein V6D28_18890, partial [Leptolyngbyaceae cyanobacterium]
MGLKIYFFSLASCLVKKWSKNNQNKSPLEHSDKRAFDGRETWHRAIVPGSDPPSIFAAAAFHNRVRDG